MAIGLGGRDYLKMLDFTSDEIRDLVDLSLKFKDLKHNHVAHRYL